MLKGEWASKHTLDEVEQWRKIGAQASVDDVAESVRGRLFDLSMFMKELKLKITLAYNKMHGRRVTLWEGPFKSVLLEGAGQGDDGSAALRTVAAFIDLNPVRAGLAREPEEYRWCSYAAAVAGVRGARARDCVSR